MVVVGSVVVSVRDAWKSYNSSGEEQRLHHVLRGLDMQISKGQIYSLFGASGSGKTTLLNCITGTLCLDSGQIELDVDSRLHIGYMPQELALYWDLTLSETFRFFGLILCMPVSQVADRSRHLSDLLRLPPVQRRISTLSGGQQRRVSAAVAMLNNPSILILDEPTVGLDLLLKQSVWEYLELLTKEQGKTVLLTTHCVEEARRSHRLAFMGQGVILLEGEPEKMLQHNNCLSVEELYYNLYRAERTSAGPTCNSPPQSNARKEKSLEHLNHYSLRRVLAFSLKTLFYIRNNMLLFYVFIFSPALMTAILKSAMQRPRDLMLGYVNLESNCTVQTTSCTQPLSCRFIDRMVDRQFHLTNFDSVEEGLAGVRKNRIWGLISFNHNFSDGVGNRLDYFYSDEPVEISDLDEASVWLDMSSYPVSYMVKKNLYDAFLDSIEGWYSACGRNAKAARPILRIENALFGQVEESLISSGIPTATVILMFSTGVALGLIFVVSEKETGTLRRCSVNGVRQVELLVSVWATCSACLGPTGIVLLLMLYLYSGPVNGPVAWVTLLTYLQAATGILLGCLIGLLTSNLARALQFTVTFMYALTYLSGMIWPAEGAHWLGKLAYAVLPSAVPTGIVRTLANRGFVDSVYLACGHSFLWIFIILIAMAVVLKINKD